MDNHVKSFRRGTHVLEGVILALAFVTASWAVIIALTLPVVLAVNSGNALWLTGYAVYAAVWAYVEGWMEGKTDE